MQLKKRFPKGYFASRRRDSRRSTTILFRYLRLKTYLAYYLPYQKVMKPAKKKWKTTDAGKN